MTTYAAPVDTETGEATRGVLIVPGTSSGRTGTVVLAAIDDDGNGGPVLAYARGRAPALQVPLRVVHVWTGRPADRVSDSDRLLSDVLHEHLPPGDITAVERQILHDDDPVRALMALSREGILLVMAAGSHPLAPGGLPGSSVRRLAGRTRCALAIVPGTAPNTERW